MNSFLVHIALKRLISEKKIIFEKKCHAYRLSIKINFRKKSCGPCGSPFILQKNNKEKKLMWSSLTWDLKKKSNLNLSKKT